MTFLDPDPPVFADLLCRPDCGGNCSSLFCEDNPEVIEDEEPW